MHVAIRCLFFLTEAGLLGLAGYIANSAGSNHLDKVYAVVLAASKCCPSTSSAPGLPPHHLTCFFILRRPSPLQRISQHVCFSSSRPRLRPITFPLDGIVIILVAIGIPSITNSSDQSVEDESRKLAVVVM